MCKVLLITSNHLRHRYVAHKVVSNLDLCAIISEEKSVETFHDNKENNWESNVIKQHFDQRNKAEKKLFGDINSFPESAIIKKVKRDESSSKTVFEWIRHQNPKIILLYGSSIIKAPVLDFYQNRIVNLHLGLSPYYRGSGTNFWPLVDGKPECVGATIHLATPNVDAGNILLQVRPENINIHDSSHEVGTKAIIAGIERLCKTIPYYLQDRLVPAKQDLSIGKVYRRKDFNAEAVNKMWKNFNNGMIENYLENKNTRDKNYPIVEPELN